MDVRRASVANFAYEACLLPPVAIGCAGACRPRANHARLREHEIMLLITDEIISRWGYAVTPFAPARASPGVPDAWTFSEVGTDVRGRVVVVDENDASRTFVCAALDSAGYEAIPVATPIGLKRALAPDRPTVVVCEVSPPLTFHQIIASVNAVHDIAGGRAPVVLCGSQPAEQLEILVRASRAAGFVERRQDPHVLRRGFHRFLAVARPTLAPDSVRRIASARSQPQWTIVKLLLVDDSEIALQMMQERLQESRFDVRIALSLGEVQSIIRGWSPNIIVADVNMPEVRGDDLCQRIKAAADTKDATVMLCSSMPEAQLAEIADAAGADGFVSKNNGLEHFVSSIEAMCRRLSNPVVSFE
jgi:CheY-like chemotaxis protein